MLSLEGLRVAMDARDLHASFDVAEGARVAVLGPSGSGKSTLLDAIAGFRTPHAGRALWERRDLTALPPQARPVSILFQDGNLFPHLAVGRNLGLALRPDGRRPDRAGRARIAEALDRVGLAGFEERLPGTLSGGQQSRAALARILLQARPLLLLDEPFSALGPAQRSDMLALVGTVADGLGATVLMVTHDPGDARALADSVIVVAEGEASAPVPTDAMLADPPPALRAYLGG